MVVIFDDPEMQEIFEGFLIETSELLDNISQDLMILENDPYDLELLNRIFRSFHTIKGTSSFMGFDSIAGITHHAEDILNKLRKSELSVNQPIIDVLLEVYDWIVSLLEEIKSGNTKPDVDFSQTIATIEILRNGGVPTQYKQEDDSTTNNENIQHIESANTDALQNNSDNDSVLDRVLDNRDMFDKPGDFTDEELELLQQAFAEVNKSFTAEKANPTSIEQKETTESKSNESEGYEGPTIWDSMDADNDNNPIPNNDNPNEIVVQDNIEDESNLKSNDDVYDAISNTTENFENSDHIAPEEIDLKVNYSQPKEVETKPQEQNNNLTQTKPKSAIDSKPKAATSNNSTETIRVDVQRLETLMDLSGELVLGRNRLSQLTNYLESIIEDKEQIKDLTETTTQIDFITSEIQSAVMRMRMVTIGKLYQKAPRIVRDLAKEFSKKIHLEVKGEETELDRGIIDELNDPLVHMIRNSCDHGIESPKERLANGKPEMGTILLDAEQEGNNIVLKIKDDGKGMDPEKLKSKAVEKGIITEEQSLQMSSREAFQLIFAPGFSTAAVVSSVSGRGVGMDVVRTNIQKLKGIIEVESEVGVGTTFIIKLPLTLAIIQGLLVKVQNETYAIPLSSVIEVVSLEQGQVNTINSQEVIRVRSEVLPIIRLDKILQTSTIKESLDNRYVVNVGLGLQRVGFVVDELLGQQEIVIKSLGEYLGTIQGIAGSTIMGDGRVIMIVDVAQLLENIYNSEFE
ncbi:MAG TPA: chemotaxis protein CheA [Candidatus Kapabacteria bacterium]|nr:chemotaxis protein CheA [Candidatus Kapabacteria bacterium]